jgi:hypothetical protein
MTMSLSMASPPHSGTHVSAETRLWGFGDGVSFAVSEFGLAVWGHFDRQAAFVDGAVVVAA